MFQGLSTDQAPPISVPFRFFLTAPIFGLLISILIFFYPANTIINRFSYETIAIVHLFTLGILTMIIFGALQQMLPVLAGCVIKKANLFANVVHTTLTLGTLFLSFGFLFSITNLLIFGSLLLAISFITFFTTIVKLLFNVKYLTPTINAMKLFTIASIITLLLGFYLIGQHIGGNIGSSHYNFVTLHILFGIFGFASILIMGVAFQIIPMFYVAPDFPKLIQNQFPKISLIILSLIVLFTLLSLNDNFLKTLLALIIISFSYFGLKSLSNRRRPVFDVTLWYWKVSLYSAMLGSIIYLNNGSMILISTLFTFGFLYSLLQGMIYKIVPFLSWFHLNAKGYFQIPTLREFIKEDDIKLQFFIYIVSILFFLLCSLDSNFIYIGSGFFFVSNLLLIYNQIVAIKKYRKILKTDPMEMFKTSNA